MITNVIPILRRTLLSGFLVVAFTLLASGCIAATPDATAHSHNSSTNAGKAITAGKNANTEVPAGSELPPNWPWRGLNMIKNGPDAAQPADIDKFADQLGINSVHLYLQLNRFAPRAGLSDAQAWSQSMQWLDAMLAKCKEYHLMAIIHLESFAKPGGGYYNPHKASFWENPAAVNEIYTEVAALAKHLQGYGNDLVAFDIISEPVMKTSLGAVRPPHWDAIQNRIIQTIRANDPGRWVIVKPGPWGAPQGYADYSPPPYPRLVYSVHMYIPGGYTNQGMHGKPLGVHYPGKIGRKYWDKQAVENALSPVIKFQNRYNALIYIGEFSAVRWAPDSDRYLRDMVSIFDSHDWGWSYHSIGGWNGWNPMYDTSYTPSGRAAQAHRVGEKSQRWQTLKAMFEEAGKDGGS